VKRVAWLVPPLPARVWALLAASLVWALALGLIIPFQAIYYHEVRGFSVEISGLVVATFAGSALLGGFAGGSASDRAGPRRAAVGSALVAASGYAALAFVDASPEAFVAAGVAGLGFGAVMPSKASLIASVAGPQHRQAAYGLEFAVVNLGFAVGAAAAGLTADVRRPETFAAILLACGGCSLLFALLVSVIGPRARPEAAGEEGRPPYRDVLRQPAIVGFAAVSLLYAAAGVAVYEVGLPLFGTTEAGLDEGQIGLLFLLNSVLIVTVQLPVTRLLEGRSRLRAVAATMLLWAAAWLTVSVAGDALQGREALAVFVPVVILFALGECIIAPVQGSLIADAAPERLRGRSLALSSSAFGTGMMAGPVGVGFVLARSPIGLWMLAAGTLLLAALVALRLEAAVPRAARRSPPRDQALAHAEP
jgi:predicted MFS family arabinose efflux permease